MGYGLGITGPSWVGRAGLLLALLAPVSPGPAAAATLYVRVGGDDAQEGRSPVTALRTITRAAAIAQPGDDIVVGPGVYVEGDVRPGAFGHIGFVADRRGTLVGDPPGDVVLDASDRSTGFELNGKIAVRIDGFVVHGAGEGIYVKSGSHAAVIVNNIVCNNRRNGIYVQDSQNATIFNNLVYNNGRSGILVGGNTDGSPGVRIVNNTVYGNLNRGIFLAGTRLESPDGRVLNNIVAENRFGGIQVNAVARERYLSAGNVIGDRVASGTPTDVTDVMADPLLVNPAGADGVLGGIGYADDDFHLGNPAAGQPKKSPAIDAGSSRSIFLKLNRASTRTDKRPDTGYVDAGYHYGNFDDVPVQPERLLRLKPIYVDVDRGADKNDGRTAATGVRTVARALEIARPGHRIVLMPGLYAEGDLTPASSGTSGRAIVLTGRPGAVIDATGFSQAFRLVGRAHVTLDGLAITGASQNGVEIRSGFSAGKISDGAYDVVIRRCRIYGNSRRGVYVGSATGVRVEATTIEDNGSRGLVIESGEVAVVRSVIGRNRDSGIWAMAGSTVSVSDTVVTDNADNGVIAWQSSLSVTGCTVTGSRDGLQQSGGTLQVVNSRIYGNTRRGIYVASAAGCSVEAATIEDNGSRGLLIEGSDVRVSGSAVRRNRDSGIWAALGSRVSLVDTDVIDNSDNGVLVWQSDFTMTGGTVSGSRDGGVRFSKLSTGTLSDVLVRDHENAGVQVVSSVVSIAGGEIAATGGRGVQAYVDAVEPGRTAVTVTAIPICGHALAGIDVTDTDLALTDVRVCDNGRDGVRQTGGTLDVVRGVVTGNQGKGITVDKAKTVVVEDTSIADNADNGLQIVAAEGLVIGGCTLSGNLGDGATILDSDSPMIWNNLVVRNRSTGVLVSGESSGSPKARVLNNTFYANGNRGLLLGGSDLKPPSIDGVVLRNVFQGNGTAGLQVNKLSLPGFVGDFNLSADPYGQGTPVGVRDILGPAGFVDPAAGDFRLSQRTSGQSVTSPAVDAGGVDVADAGLTGTTTRTDGRPDVGPVDLGYHYRP